MNISSKVVIPAPEGTCIFGISTIYVNQTQPHLLQTYCHLPRSDTFDSHFTRISDDNGRTWTEPENLYQPVTTEEGIWRWAETAVTYDPVRETVLLFYNYARYSCEGYSLDRDATIRIFYRTSQDEGKSFSSPIQLIVKGHDTMNWAPGILYGKNSAMISFCAPFWIGERLFLPAAMLPLGSDYTGHFPHHYHVLCFIGSWKGKELEWEMSTPITVPHHLSAEGLDEPTVAELEDGRILMAMRGGNAGGPGQPKDDTPSHKWFSLSVDGGYEWTVPKPWTYENGDPFFSPSTGSRLLRHSKDGKLYWLGNITPENPQGNLPRYPLVIAEVDEASGLLLKKKVTTILERNPDQSKWIQYSNFRAYEDRMTGEIVVTLPHLGERTQDLFQFDFTAPGYEHRVVPHLR